MKILVVTDNLRDQVNGVVTTYKNIEDCAISAGHSIVYLDPRQFRYINCPLYPEVKLSIPTFFIRKIEKMGADHIHIATEGPLGLWAKFYCDANKKPYTTAYHTKFPEFLKKLAWVPTSLTYRYLNWFHRHSKAVLVPSRSLKRELEQINFKNIVVWTRGVSQELIKPRITNTKSYPLKVLYVGRVSPEKNLDALCELQHQYEITIVGDGPILQHLKRKYPKVNYVGYKYGEDLAQIYSENDVFAFPSLTDTFGIVVIEAMCNGLPVAAYRVTGPQDSIEYGVTGYMVQPGNNLSEAIDMCRSLDNKKVQALSVNQWTWQKCFDIFLGVIIK
jgi:glycosyltransferase involved in cell wall biosynthesis